MFIRLSTEHVSSESSEYLLDAAAQPESLEEGLPIFRSNLVCIYSTFCR